MTSQTLLNSVRTVAEAWKQSPYYADAEKWTFIFWGEGAIFPPLFAQLDLENVVELACGHGRHAEQIVGRAGRFTLMDVHLENIEASRKRLGERPNLRFVVNNGYDFRPMPDNSVTSIFCYDAMVHFSPDLVESYLKDAARVLRPGGKALLHHSNYDAPPERHYGQNPHARNHMTLLRFQSYVLAAGLTILQSTPIEWGQIPDLDCVSLVAKPS